MQLKPPPAPRGPSGQAGWPGSAAAAEERGGWRFSHRLAQLGAWATASSFQAPSSRLQNNTISGVALLDFILSNSGKPKGVSL